MNDYSTAPVAFLATIAASRGEWEELGLAALVAVLTAVLQWLTRRKP